MTLAWHISMGVVAYHYLSWWSLLLAVPLHLLSDALCLWHPPGMGWPWGTQKPTWRSEPLDSIGRVVLDEWQYPWEYGCLWVYCGHSKCRDLILKRIMFCLNVAACIVLILGTCVPDWGTGWRACLAGLASWLLVDCWWACRDWLPGLYDRIGWLNPHRLVVWLKPSYWWASLYEMGGIVAFTVWAVCTAR